MLQVFPWIYLMEWRFTVIDRYASSRILFRGFQGLVRDRRFRMLSSSQTTNSSDCQTSKMTWLFCFGKNVWNEFCGEELLIPTRMIFGLWYWYHSQWHSFVLYAYTHRCHRPTIETGINEIILLNVTKWCFCSLKYCMFFPRVFRRRPP